MGMIVKMGEGGYRKDEKEEASTALDEPSDEFVVSSYAMHCFISLRSHIWLLPLIHFAHSQCRYQ